MAEGELPSISAKDVQPDCDDAVDEDDNSEKGVIGTAGDDRHRGQGRNDQE
jgi:hypothetical protein